MREVARFADLVLVLVFLMGDQRRKGLLCVLGDDLVTPRYGNLLESTDRYAVKNGFWRPKECAGVKGYREYIHIWSFSEPQRFSAIPHLLFLSPAEEHPKRAGIRKIYYLGKNLDIH